MFQPGLQLEQAPPISVPFRFFLTAPVFLLLAALLLLWSGAEALEARQSPATLALTHLITLGFMTMVMIGAMMQMLPVLAGSPVPGPLATAAVVHVGLALGTLMLAAGFLSGQPWMLEAGAVALGAGFLVFGAAIIISLLRARVQNNTVRAMWLPAASLLPAVVIGVALALSLGLGWSLPNLSLRDLHPGWALLGWTGLLVVGVAYQVVPMFQITPAYPRSMIRYLGATIIVLLGAWSLARWFDAGDWGVLAAACALAISTAYALFGVVTIALQRRRKRRLPDVTLDFWRLGMSSLVAASVLWAVRVAFPWEWPAAFDVLIGVLVLVGFAVSVISGMLYKIMSFLAWFHLQAITGAGRVVPNMKKILGDASQRRQFRAHVATLVLLIGAALWPQLLVYPAALALGADAVLLGLNMLKVLKVYDANLRLLGTFRAASQQAAERSGS
jgi:hypothetical protein